MTNCADSIAQQIQNIEIEVNSRCNRRCTYCPVSILPNPDVPKFMADDLLHKVVKELGNAGYGGRISYHFYNEPLLRKDLEQIVSHVKEGIPLAHQVLYTNGDYLTQARYETLRAAGIELFVVTSHSGKQHPARERQVVQFSKDLELTNRGGSLAHITDGYAQAQQQRCFAPSEMLIITVTGEVVLCYEDSFRKHVMGSFATQSLSDIWYGEPFSSLRKSLAEGDRSVTSICQKCSNRAHTDPGRSARSEPFWNEIPVSW